MSDRKKEPPKEKPLTKKGFFDALNKVIRTNPPKKRGVRPRDRSQE